MKWTVAVIRKYVLASWSIFLCFAVFCKWLSRCTSCINASQDMWSFNCCYCYQLSKGCVNTYFIHFFQETVYYAVSIRWIPCTIIKKYINVNEKFQHLLCMVKNYRQIRIICVSNKMNPTLLEWIIKLSLIVLKKHRKFLFIT